MKSSGSGALGEGAPWEGLWLILCLNAHSHLPYDVTPEQALSHPEVQRRLDISLHSLLAVTDKFLVAIMSSVDRIPYVHQPHPGQASMICKPLSLNPGRWKEIEFVGGTSIIGIVIIKSSTFGYHTTSTDITSQFSRKP